MIVKVSETTSNIRLKVKGQGQDRRLASIHFHIMIVALQTSNVIHLHEQDIFGIID